MDDSIAHPQLGAGSFELPAWKHLLSVSSAIVLAVLFVVAGTWKITDPHGAAARLTQALVPAAVSLPFAIMLGISETFAGVLLLVPRFRRWGAWLAGVLLVAFVLYMGFFYSELRGEECNCFPWIKRAVGPAFFIGDAVMLLLAVWAGWWAHPSESRRSAALVLAAVSVFAVVSYGVTETRLSVVLAPNQITANGQPFSLHDGRVFLYFFDPECSHCYMAAKDMAAFAWKGTRVVAIPTTRQQFAAQFLADTGLGAAVSTDVEKLRKTFSFGDPPYAVALENGRQRAAFPNFDENEPRTTLAKLGYIE